MYCKYNAWTGSSFFFWRPKTNSMHGCHMVWQRNPNPNRVDTVRYKYIDEHEDLPIVESQNMRNCIVSFNALLLLLLTTSIEFSDAVCTGKATKCSEWSSKTYCEKADTACYWSERCTGYYCSVTKECKGTASPCYERTTESKCLRNRYCKWKTSSGSSSTLSDGGMIAIIIVLLVGFVGLISGIFCCATGKCCKKEARNPLPSEQPFAGGAKPAAGVIAAQQQPMKVYNTDVEMSC